MALKIGDLSKVPPKQKILLVVMASLLLVVGYYYGIYVEKEAEIKTLGDKLAGLESKIKEQQVIARNLQSFQEEVRLLEERLTLLLEQLPNSSEIPALLKSVADVGKESGLEFMRFAPGGEVGKGFYAEIPVSIAVQGDYHSFVLFADKVSHLPRIVNLSNLAFGSPKSSKTGDDQVTISATCTATTYRFLEQAATVPVASTAKADAGKEKKK